MIRFFVCFIFPESIHALWEPFYSAHEYFLWLFLFIQFFHPIVFLDLLFHLLYLLVLLYFLQLLSQCLQLLLVGWILFRRGLKVFLVRLDYKWLWRWLIFCLFFLLFFLFMLFFLLWFLLLLFWCFSMLFLLFALLWTLFLALFVLFISLFFLALCSLLDLFQLLSLSILLPVRRCITLIWRRSWWGKSWALH